MAVHEQIQGTTPPSPLSPDPNVIVPEHVRRAAEAAEALHKKTYTPAAEPAQPAAQAEPAQPEPAQTPGLQEPARVTAPAQPQPDPVQPVQNQAPAADENVSAEEWRHRYLSMQGRFNAAVRDNGALQQQMAQIAQELVRTQELVQAQTAQPQAQPQRPDHGNLITDEDRRDYGDELIDLQRRVALSAVTPEIERLREENQRLTQRVQNTGKRELFATLDGAVPNWRAINNSPQFKAWLRLPNVYTSQIRKTMLDNAVAGAEAPKVVALFRDFLSEAAATGQTAPSAQVEQQPAPVAPRTPALELETLAAPGRARPAPGDTQVPVDKPIYTRAQISKFYDDSRRGLYAGREAEYRQTEADMQAAQREGRIR